MQQYRTLTRQVCDMRSNSDELAWWNDSLLLPTPQKRIFGIHLHVYSYNFRLQSLQHRQR